METQIVSEGRAEFVVPKLEKYKTSEKEYVPSQTPVFFNPVMSLSRDISVSSLEILGQDIEGLRICDVLSGVGARGIRYALELSSVGKVVVNDNSSDAVALIEKNVDMNDTSSVEVREEDANVLLSHHRPRFHVIDLDPFGSPVPFLDSAFTAVSRRGFIFATATDTAPLCGAYPKPCLRRYGAKPLRNYYSRELGLRIFIGSVQRRAAAYDLALTPVLSHATQHYFRVHFRVSQGARKADEILEGQGYVSHCFDCERRVYAHGMPAELPRECECGREYEHAGPLWLGEFAEVEHLHRVIEVHAVRDFDRAREERDLLEKIAEEADGPPTFYDLHDVSSQAGVSPPKLESVLKELQEKGHFASRTHFSGTGIRTDATLDDLVEVVLS